MYSSNIEAINFASLYSVQRVASTHKKKDKEEWNKKAKDMNKKVHSGFYNDTIEKSISFDKKDTLLDVGCGPGTFSLRFAPLVKQVNAFDFSSKMLEILEENAKEQNIKNISSFIHDMEKSWVDVPTCDIVLASRCLEVDNIEAVLKELDTHARKAVYLTYKVGISYLDEEVLNAIGRQITPKPDYIYLINVLYNMGIYAQLQFIFPEENSSSTVSSEEEYIQAISWSLDGISKEENKRASQFYKQCLLNGKTPPLRDNRWALISWKKN
ncbi:class I SAM-dependent methyltransferase [Poseidonibacter lekithochrous]|uniref:class I SAM-dependent methyltransferase n=1 Tax=Poseidonibacter TaxID=2321187 RepID=UPI001C09D45A|nr:MULTISPECIES: class I SAM-dependent methyltransferase [Poseidonibacter]MBU3013333.1 class I SAM-dependent methyltransferase [Poseidonibacter lekithochrous]MDO6826630.1 class I SAM-dependent methyltransferase [Poseidonibacter sp. 1_MG-2023]